MKKTLIVILFVITGCDITQNSNSGNSESENIKAVSAAWGEAVTNTARAYFRLGVATGDLTNLRRRQSGQAEIRGEQLLEDAIKTAGNDPYLIAPN